MDPKRVITPALPQQLWRALGALGVPHQLPLRYDSV